MSSRGGSPSDALATADTADGSSTGTRVPSNWALLPRSRDSQEPAGHYGNGHVNRFRQCKVDFSGAFSSGKVIMRRQLKRRYILPLFQK